MSNLNACIRELALEIAGMARLSGGRMSLETIHHCLNPDASEKVARVIGLAIERAIGLRILEPCGVGDTYLRTRMGGVEVSEKSASSTHVSNGDLEITKSKKEYRRKSRATGKPHRLHVQGRALRRLTREVLLEKGGALRGREVYERLPESVKPASLHNFHHALHKMRDEGLIIRLAQGWYCHPEHISSGEAQYRDYRLSKKYLDGAYRSSKEEVRKRMIQRRKKILNILRCHGRPMKAIVVFRALRAHGFDISLTRFRRDIGKLACEGSIVRVKYGWYGFPSAS